MKEKCGTCEYFSEEYECCIQWLSEADPEDEACCVYESNANDEIKENFDEH